MALSPMMRQYVETKEKYKDSILFFRVGDFYEMFFDDAKLISRELELVLTGKDCGLEERAPMCGIPYHAASNYISRLINKGYKIAICEQVEDPSTAKGLVKRDVIKVITPGTYIDSSLENESSNTYVVVILEEDNKIGIALSDISTGEFKTTTFTNLKTTLLDEITKIAPKEVIVDTNYNESIINEIVQNTGALITYRDLNKFMVTDKELVEQFTEAEIQGLESASINASKVLLKYIFETQKMSLTNINFLESYDIVNFMTIDSNSRRNLELTESLREKVKKGSLLWVLDKTSTTMGGRALRRMVEEPLIIKEEIDKRLDAVQELVSNVNLNEDLREVLKDIYDIERIVGKVSSGNVNGKDLLSLKSSIVKIPFIKEELKNAKSPLLKEYYNDLDELLDIKDILEAGINEDSPVSIKEGNIIKDGYNEMVDELRKAKYHGKEWIASLENSEREITGIKSLKVGYNKVFGYYIEISKSNYDLIPEGRYIRKQTLTNAERFITPELKEMEEKILGSEEKLVKLEYELFVEIRKQVEAEITRLKKSARIIGYLDAFCSLAKVALENDFVRPNINEDGNIIISEGRHPVVEKVINRGEFVANDTKLNQNDNQLLLITGPNMAGKSTYMRQVALITLMAQIGSFVPAKSADISICDRIFTRIGASDDLAGGKSTFMVEMWEVSNILKNATRNSLVLLDEVGRGTSTYDGLSIAMAVIEHICNNPSLKCKTLFATHYHELTKLEGKIDGVKNYSVAVKEIDNNVIFLRKIIEGGADQSYGIEVAKLAGLPMEVINRAKNILEGLEDKQKDSTVVVKEVIKEVPVEVIKEVPVEVYKETSDKQDNMQMDFSSIEKDNFIKKLAETDVLTMTPMDAMNQLYKLIQGAKELV